MCRYIILLIQYVITGAAVMSIDLRSSESIECGGRQLVAWWLGTITGTWFDVWASPVAV